MKLFLSPPKAAVLALLATRLKETQETLDKHKAELVELESKKEETKLHNPYLDAELSNKESLVGRWEDEEARLHDKIGLLEACEGNPTVEIDLD